ncbi:pentapeptide repeat-containing protein [Paenibacillus sp. 7124]|uniref:Pentapeptide repeat-containing protein n=1 Tax=Paenibacillus apii TaxID=1850370 RepID=A0A6M1PIG6_9BACL|nr:pentapeptide repeat-containing protein [Paenibacillus apii]NGM83239.1 pentapeptide repeat-containing protein [Paenibacillus apii]
MSNHLKADCAQCFGLCCAALPYAKSADFAADKAGGIPCPNLQADYRCGIHNDLRAKGYKGCTVYECFGAGQKVSQITYKGKDWRKNPGSAQEMFEVFPIMQQLHEMLCYLNEALERQETGPINTNLRAALESTENLTKLDPVSIIKLDVPAHRAVVNDLLLQTSERVRANVPPRHHNHQKAKPKMSKRNDYIGANLREADLRGANLRGALLIAADLRKVDMRQADLIGADFRDADLRGADLTGSIFLTQAQINSAKGDIHTKLPPSLTIPGHWMT